MGRIAKIVLATLAALLVWAAIVIVGTREGWWRPLPAPRGDVQGFIDAAKTRFAKESKGDIALVLIQNSKVAGEYYASHGKPVDGQSLFQVASMSKWFTAWGVMALVERGKLDLDIPVSHYLKRWHLPPSKFDNNGVTLRRLLSHTAGLTDGLSYRGFSPGEKPQGLEASLTHAADAMPMAPGSVIVGMQPGSAWKYSGGGYALMQLIIEEVSGQSFNDYMRSTVLLPLGMTQSTFVAPDPNYLADNFDADGKPATRYTFTALAAASLYTSTADLTRFMQAQVPGPNGEPAGRGVLKPSTLALMRHAQATLWGFPLWGLGNVLYDPNNKGGYIVGHDGNNYPAINTTARIDPATGDGIIVLETGNGTVASEIGSDWDYWHTGTVDILAIVSDAQRTMIIFAIGALLIVVAAGVIGWRGRRPS